MSSLSKISVTDHRLINPHLEFWAQVMSEIPPDSVLTNEEIDKRIPETYTGEYRRQFVGALIRYSLARGELKKLGKHHFVRVGRSRESAVELAQLMSLGGWQAEEISPGTFLGYEDLEHEDGRRERHYSCFARRAGESFRWMIVSVPIVQSLTEPFQRDERTQKMIAQRLDALSLM